ncbi:glycerophosphodiester phosphodiesterase family protein [Demequina muriae]|uniref:Glycerophosphodiester phosphodiesterase family protein n=1 Tax=Demequina muriae TaxID=3051664 RepID=A0ABT8GGF4_9MICO|nr:glycerophosphodiester phosphodiesterase family protein [Demequina sp. EGI L300058]MDN4480513.1 glycerophosphodiester phosphodiesterase family protein [Demequina sp. EGI L300058]
MTPRHPYFDNGGRPIALAHRGFSLEGLENSMKAFQAAVDLGYRYLETDAHGTRDGVAVALHDETLDRTTDATGLVAERDWDSVKAARIGGVEPVPRLDDVLGTWPDARINIDVKGESGIRPVAEAIERTRSHDRVCVGSFSADRRRATLKLLSRPVATPASEREAIAWLVGTWVGADAHASLGDVDALQIPWRKGPVPFLFARQIEAAHAAGREVHVWTVNRRDHMVHLLDLGVDGLVSDRADILKEVLVARGQWA